MFQAPDQYCQPQPGQMELIHAEEKVSGSTEVSAKIYPRIAP